MYHHLLTVLVRLHVLHGRLRRRRVGRALLLLRGPYVSAVAAPLPLAREFRLAPPDVRRLETRMTEPPHRRGQIYAADTGPHHFCRDPVILYCSCGIGAGVGTMWLRAPGAHKMLSLLWLLLRLRRGLVGVLCTIRWLRSMEGEGERLRLLGLRVGGLRLLKLLGRGRLRGVLKRWLKLPLLILLRRLGLERLLLVRRRLLLLIRWLDLLLLPVGLQRLLLLLVRLLLLLLVSLLRLDRLLLLLGNWGAAEWRSSVFHSQST